MLPLVSPVRGLGRRGRQKLKDTKMKKQSKTKTAAEKQAAAKPKRTKLEAVGFKFTVGGVSYEVSDTATDTELLKALVIGMAKLSEQLEAIRRTLWRIGEIREYESKGAKAAAKGNPKADAANG